MKDESTARFSLRQASARIAQVTVYGFDARGRVETAMRQLRAASEVPQNESVPAGFRVLRSCAATHA